MHAQVENLETCAAKECVQPAEVQLGHLGKGEPVQVVLLGYCPYHADKIMQRRLAGLPDQVPVSTESAPE